MPTTSALSRGIADTIATLGAKLLRNRRLVRAPIWLYRARLGFVLGSRMLMLEHVGRKSGVRRRVVLEVFGHPRPDTYLIVSGFGTRAQWYRNLLANPRARVWVSSRAPAEATARPLSTQEADKALRAYIDQHPRYWEKFKPIVEATLGAPVTDHDTALPVFELRLDQRR